MIRRLPALVKRFVRTSAGPTGRSFVSYSYKDADTVPALEAAVGSSAELRVFPPITVPPELMVSSELLSSIRECKTLVYIKTANAAKSPWVALERDYALRSGLDVYAFNPSARDFVRDTSAPLDLPVFASYAHANSRDVEPLLKVMKEERFFDVFMDVENIPAGANFAGAISSAIANRLERGGYMTLFWSHASARSEWVSAEFGRALASYRDRILLVLLDGAEVPPKLADLVPVQLRHSSEEPFDYRRLDDVIVRLYWLIHRNTRGEALDA